MAADPDRSLRVDTLALALIAFVDAARPAPFDLEKLTNEFGLYLPDARASFLNQVFSLLKQLPVQAYASERQRNTVLDAAQAALDQADLDADAAKPAFPAH